MTYITDQEIGQFDQAGAVTIDTPLTAQEIADAVEAFQRLLPFEAGNFRPSLTCNYYDSALINLIQHPFFEAVAQRVLQAEKVWFFQTAMLTAYPEPGKPFSFWQHVDLQYRLSDFQAVPKKILCSFFLWLTDVNEQRAPMMFRPGSHLLLAERNQHDPAWPDGPPQVAPMALKNLPALPYADPVPLTAKAGQVSVLTTAAVHGASVNVDSEPRMNFVLTFLADDAAIGLPPHEEAEKRDYHAGLRSCFRSERTHILPL